MGVNENEGSYFLLYAFVKNESFNAGEHSIAMASEKDFERNLHKVRPLLEH